MFLNIKSQWLYDFMGTYQWCLPINLYKVAQTLTFCIFAPLQKRHFLRTTDDDDDVHFNELQSKGVKKSILYV
jgi:hypothetical protein